MKEELLKKVAWIGGENLARPIKEIVLKFSGLGVHTMKGEAEDDDLAWASHGGLVVVPYHNPWTWMNQDTVDFVDELIDGLRGAYHLDENVPIISTGGSMGGHGALLYTILSRHKIDRCVAICPACDLTYHYNERVNLPKTMHSTFRSYGDITDQLVAHSVVHQAYRLPAIDYLMVHGTRDEAVSKECHSDPVVATLRGRGISVEYIEVDMGHGGPVPDDVRWRWIDFVSERLLHL